MTEHRSSNRHPVNIDVQVTHNGTSDTQVITNLSLGGALIAMEERLALGVTLDLVFQIPTAEEAIRVKAMVRWVSDDATGVQFDGLRAREVWSLNEYFKQFTS